MKKYIKFVVLFIIAFSFPFKVEKALTQNEIESKYRSYSEIFELNSEGKANNCTYKFDGSSNSLGFSQFKIIFTKTNGKLDIFDSYYFNNGFRGDSVISHSVSMGWHRIDDLNPVVLINTDNFDYGSLLEQLKNNNSCLNQVYFCRDRTSTQEHQFALSTSANGDCETFTDINAKDEPNGCNKNDAKSCKKYNKTIAGENFEIEIGITTNNKKYFILKNSSFTHESDALFNTPTASWSGGMATVINDNVFPQSCTNNSCEWPNDIYVIHSCLGDNDHYYITLSGASYNSSDIEGTISEEKCYVEESPLDPPSIRDPESAGNPEISEIGECTSLLGDPYTEGHPAFYLNKAFTVVKYVAIVLLVVLSMFDFISAVSSGDEKALRNATNKTIKRAILCIAIYLLPTLISFALKYLNDRAADLCGIGGGR